MGSVSYFVQCCLLFQKRDFQNGTVAAVFTDLLTKAFGRAFSFLKERQKYQDAKISARW